MRALFIIHELALNGAVTSLLAQARRMIAQGQHVTLLTPRLEGASAALLPSFLEAGAKVVNAANWAEYDVAVGCTVFAADALHDLIGRLPLVWWIHEGRAGVRYFMSNPKTFTVLGHVGKLIFASKPVAEWVFAAVLGELPPGRVEVIPYIVQPPDSRRADPAPKPPGTVRVLCVGSVYPRKRQSDLVQAVGMLRGRPVECVLVGEIYRPLDATGEQIARADPERFRLTGGLQPDAVRGYYRSADVFSLPSSDENMPLAPVEAAWHDVPVVLSDLKCYEGIWRHGVNALIHPVGDVEMLAWYVRMLIESAAIRQRLVAAGRTVAARFGERRAGALFDAALEEAIGAWQAAGSAKEAPR
ncbi:MAG: glycosyltransferase family 4 protein [Pseudomonadota bacterium]|nr:glycosyltransferase family 4 protein [Pseudomonadota bacterium]